MSLRKLPRSFYLQPTLQVAKHLLGKLIVRRYRNEVLIGRIVETEAYLGEKDPASHAYRGMTKRNEVMFRKGGHLYVHFTYGMHFCANVVTEEEGKGRAVLLRAVEPSKGLKAMERRRGFPRIAHNLTNGPAKLCEAFGIAAKENGTDLCGQKIWIAADTSRNERIRIGVSSRIGITNGRRYRWRFYIVGNPFISKARPVDG